MCEIKRIPFRHYDGFFDELKLFVDLFPLLAYSEVTSGILDGTLCSHLPTKKSWLRLFKTHIRVNISLLRNISDLNLFFNEVGDHAYTLIVVNSEKELRSLHEYLLKLSLGSFQDLLGDFQSDFWKNCFIMDVDYSDNLNMYYQDKYFDEFVSTIEVLAD
jgi:hypothetical protein